MSKAGYLHKLAGRGLKSQWAVRWFILEEDILYYYREKNENTPLGKVILKDVLLHRRSPPEQSLKSEYSFFMKTSLTTHYFYADSEDDMNEWLHACSAVTGLAIEDGDDSRPGSRKSSMSKSRRMTPSERIAKSRETARQKAEQEAQQAKIDAVQAQAREKKEKQREEELKKKQEEALENARVEKARLEAEKLAQERLEQKRLEQERLDKIAREEQEEEERIQREALRREEERFEREAMQRERLEKERLQKERMEKVRRENERLEQIKLDEENFEKERKEKERKKEQVLAAARAAAEKKDRERKEKEKESVQLKIEQARKEAERKEMARKEAARLESNRLEKERLRTDYLKASNPNHRTSASTRLKPASEAKRDSFNNKEERSKRDSSRREFARKEAARIAQEVAASDNTRRPSRPNKSNISSKPSLSPSTESWQRPAYSDQPPPPKARPLGAKEELHSSNWQRPAYSDQPLPPKAPPPGQKEQFDTQINSKNWQRPAYSDQPLPPKAPPPGKNRKYSQQPSPPSGSQTAASPPQLPPKQSQQSRPKALASQRSNPTIPSSHLASSSPGTKLYNQKSNNNNNNKSTPNLSSSSKSPSSSLPFGGRPQGSKIGRSQTSNNSASSEFDDIFGTPTKPSIPQKPGSPVKVPLAKAQSLQTMSSALQSQATSALDDLDFSVPLTSEGGANAPKLEHVTKARPKRNKVRAPTAKTLRKQQSSGTVARQPAAKAGDSFVDELDAYIVSSTTPNKKTHSPGVGLNPNVMNELRRNLR